MSPASPQLVPLEELGPQLGGGNAETAAARLAATGLPTPVTDWQGRLAVPVEVLRRRGGGAARPAARRRGTDQGPVRVGDPQV
jgi:hypothetical protein